ncbi:cupin domain [Edaphobacter aggregans]|uniref:Cupin domain n=1 Tax=Edaphobacter aggregans TaxID=570835 RepID=A0A428MIW8_9BACT|nr:cupin domain-containing protein [Edaphobacter aggregans]RSL16855.1 cupin domain [Edaphobacter aggregans]
MKRRNFLKSAASTFPLALTQPFALAVASNDIPLKEAHVVPAGQDIFGENRTLGFSRISFKTSTHDTGGDLLVVEHNNLLPGGPPLHLHLAQDEWFYIMEGEVLFQVGDKRLKLKPGDSVLAPRKIPHTFTGAGTTPAKMLIAFTPAGKMEQFFRDTAHGKADLMDAALFRKYDMELVGPPLKLT